MRLNTPVAGYALFALLAGCSSSTSNRPQVAVATAEPPKVIALSPQANCNDIEAEYLRLATTSVAMRCETTSDCRAEVGLCKSDGSRVIGNAEGVYNKATRRQLKHLRKEWSTNQCGGSCNATAGGLLDCAANKCSVL